MRKIQARYFLCLLFEVIQTVFEPEINGFRLPINFDVVRADIDVILILGIKLSKGK